ncbi:MAG TPA: protein phosphatase CheZ, partial [Quisquiliibacterium sp.]|nr:protein phosphatase CheZ [Quisquiliibacterium sp.]
MHTTSAPADAAGIPPAVTSGGAPVEPEALYMRLGELTRTLHEALRGLGYDRQLEEVVSTLPEARSRLSYIARLTGDAAEKV